MDSDALHLKMKKVFEMGRRKMQENFENQTEESCMPLHLMVVFQKRERR